MGVSRAVAEELLIEPFRERLLSDQNFLSAVSALKKGRLENQIEVFEPKAPSIHSPSGEGSISGAGIAGPGRSPSSCTGDLPTVTLLAAKINAIEAAAALGAMSQREAACRCAALRAEHDHHALIPIDDETSILANAERRRAALISAATDALRDALRRTLGTVRCQPTVEGETRYLLAQFVGGDAALLDWLCIGDAAKPGLSALVAGDRFVNYRRVLTA